jgi:hypothetical protein
MWRRWHVAPGAGLDRRAGGGTVGSRCARDPSLIVVLSSRCASDAQRHGNSAAVLRPQFDRTSHRFNSSIRNILGDGALEAPDPGLFQETIGRTVKRSGGTVMRSRELPPCLPLLMTDDASTKSIFALGSKRNF